MDGWGARPLRWLSVLVFVFWSCLFYLFLFLGLFILIVFVENKVAGVSRVYFHTYWWRKCLYCNFRCIFSALFFFDCFAFDQHQRPSYLTHWNVPPDPGYTPSTLMSFVLGLLFTFDLFFLHFLFIIFSRPREAVNQGGLMESCTCRHPHCHCRPTSPLIAHGAAHPCGSFTLIASQCCLCLYADF